MILSDGRSNPKLLFFGVDPSDKENLAFSAGLAYYAGGSPPTIELFDENGESWGRFNTPLAAQSFFKLTAQAVVVYKMT